MRSRTTRVPTQMAARLIDEMLAALTPNPPARLYRLLAQHLGLHHVTVLRYHRCTFRTIRSDRLRVLQTVHGKVMSGELRSPDLPPRTVRRDHTVEKRVCTSTLRPLFERLRDRLQLTEYSVLYRCLSEQTGLSISSLRRFHRGTQGTAPRRLEFTLQRLLSECKTANYPPLTRSAGGERVVPRAAYCLAIDRLDTDGRYRSKSELFRILGASLGESPDRLRRPYYNDSIRLVPLKYCAGADRLAARMEYDPAKTFTMGERIKHHAYGSGVVRDKRSRHSVLVEFEGGREVLLRENFQHDSSWERNTDSVW